MKISLLHPSRSRIDRSFATTSKWMNNCIGSEVELIISLDDNDPHLSTYLELYTHFHNCKIIVNPNRSAIDAINNAAKVATGDIMMVLSDDTDCPANWAEQILVEVRGKKDYVLRVEDGIQTWLITAPIIHRDYYNRFGYVYYPEYLHMFSDCEFTHVANILGKVKRSDLLFPHLHYSVRRLGIKPDEINHRADRTTTQGRDLYLQRFKERFGLEVPWTHPWYVDDKDHLRWLHHHLPL